MTLPFRLFILSAVFMLTACGYATLADAQESESGAHGNNIDESDYGELAASTETGYGDCDGSCD